MTEQFQFDTSGLVPLQGPPARLGAVAFGDLPPGVQGCIDGMFRSMVRVAQSSPPDASGRWARWSYEIPGLCAGGGYASEADAWTAAAKHLHFDMIHADALARIIADWERFSAAGMGENTIHHGRRFWC